jgi:hypothetical protein
MIKLESQRHYSNQSGLSDIDKEWTGRNRLYLGSVVVATHICLACCARSDNLDCLADIRLSCETSMKQRCTSFVLSLMSEGAYVLKIDQVILTIGE